MLIKKTVVIICFVKAIPSIQMLSIFILVYAFIGGTRVAAISFAEIAEIEFTYGPDVDTFDKVIERINLLKVSFKLCIAMQRNNRPM